MKDIDSTVMAMQCILPNPMQCILHLLFFDMIDMIVVMLVSKRKTRHQECWML